MGASAAGVHHCIRLAVAPGFATSFAACVAACLALSSAGCGTAQPPLAAPPSPTFAALRTRTERLLRQRVDAQWLALIGRTHEAMPEPMHAGNAERDRAAERDLAIIRAAISAQPEPTPRPLHHLHSFLISEASDTASAPSLGYRNELDLARDLLHFDPRGVVKLAEALLHESKALALDGPVSDSSRAGNEGSATNMPDPRDNPEAELSADRLLPALQQTVTGIGMTLAAPPLAVFVTGPEATSAVAECFVLGVPDEVRLYVGMTAGGTAAGGTVAGGTAAGAPVPGRAGYRAALAAVGRCLSAVHARAEPFELWRLGDKTSAASFARLFASLVDDPQWLADVVGIEEPQLSQLARQGALVRLAHARADARLVITGMSFGGDLSIAPDRPSLFAAARRLRARVLAASLRAILIATGERRWWRATTAGNRLRELWAGTSMSGEELATQIGTGELRPTALLTEIAQAMARVPAP